MKAKKVTGLNWRQHDDVDEDYKRIATSSEPPPMSEAEREIATHWWHHDERMTFKGHPLSYCERVEGYYRFASEHHFVTCDTCAFEVSLHYGDDPRCWHGFSGHRSHRHDKCKPPR